MHLMVNWERHNEMLITYAVLTYAIKSKAREKAYWLNNNNITCSLEICMSRDHQINLDVMAPFMQFLCN